MSLLSEMFRKDATIGGERGDTPGSRTFDRDGDKPISRLPFPGSRPGIAGSSFVEEEPPPPLGLPTTTRTTTTTTTRRVRYDPSLPEREPRSSTRRTGRRQSPPQKIDRSPIRNQETIEDALGEERRDEAGHNDDSMMSGHHCFSYRTMEKEYEKASLRMLERIRKSRSFEKEEVVGATAPAYRPWNSCHLPESVETTLEGCATEASGGDFYIGDGCEDFLAASTPSLALLSSYGDDFDGSDRHSCDDDDEIFELDL